VSWLQDTDPFRPRGRTVEGTAAPTVRSRTLRTRVEPGRVFAAFGTEGPAAVRADPADGPAFIGLAATEQDVVVADDVAAEGLPPAVAGNTPGALLAFVGRVSCSTATR
jgi:hypothetical protein